jgi:outer membrane protein OmpA-like peptidoglycan-associated protein
LILHDTLIRKRKEDDMIHVSKSITAGFAAAVLAAAIVAGCANAPLRTEEASASGSLAAANESAKAPEALELFAKSEKDQAASLHSEAGADGGFLKEKAASARPAKKDVIHSEKRTAADAHAELARFAVIKEEERGLVATLSGGVLFRSAESTLLPSARVKLDRVARALLSVNERNVIVEGHTDSRGSESYNQYLSQRRADAVREYIVERGYPADRIQSYGLGKASPIASNASPAGRAGNRRVEIVIEREIQTSCR